MKREAMNHTKMKRLCRRMDIELWQAVGLLESLWHLTAREAPRGDIGKLSDEDIALALDYRGDETALINHLIGAGWLDRHPTGRLVIHDWPDHADDAVHMRLARARQFFIDGKAPKLTKLPSKEKESAQAFYLRAHGVSTPDRLPEPEPEPEPEPINSPLPPKGGMNGVSPDPDGLPFATPLDPQPFPPEVGGCNNHSAGRNGNHRGRSVAEAIQGAAERIHARHPKERRDMRVERIAKTLEAILKHRHVPGHEQTAFLDRLDRTHAAMCASEGWQKDGGQFAKGLENWLAPTKERYLNEPPTPVNGPGQPSQYTYSPPTNLLTDDQIAAERARKRAQMETRSA